MATNFNDSLPAAPTGGTNVKFQTDGSGNDSAYIPTPAINLTGSSVNLTGQQADITTTTLLTPSASGLYRISVYAIVTAVSSPGSTLPAVIIGWTDQDNMTAQTLTVTASSTGNALTTFEEEDAIISALTGDVITFSTSGYASGGTPMQFSLRIRIEAL